MNLKNQGTQQKNWKTRKKNGRWIFLCVLFIFGFGVQTVLPSIIEYHKVFATENQGDPFKFGTGAADGRVENFVKTEYRIEGDYIYWTQTFSEGSDASAGYYVFTVPKSVATPENWIVSYQADGTGVQKSVKNHWNHNDGSAPLVKEASGITYQDEVGNDRLSTDRDMKRKLNENLQMKEKRDEVYENSQNTAYTLRVNGNSSKTSRWVVMYRTRIINRNLPLSYLAGYVSQDGKGINVLNGVSGILLREDKDIRNDYNLTWDNSSVDGRNDLGFKLSEDRKTLIYRYDIDDKTPFNLNDILDQLNVVPKGDARVLDGPEKKQI